MRKPLPEVSAGLRKAPLSVTVQTIPQTVIALCIPKAMWAALQEIFMKRKYTILM